MCHNGFSEKIYLINVYNIKQKIIVLNMLINECEE
jgi:hypothetical protein